MKLASMPMGALIPGAVVALVLGLVLAPPAALAADLIARKVDVIVTGGGNVATAAARDATKTIPIVMSSSAGAVEAGLIECLARPGFANARAARPNAMIVGPDPLFFSERDRVLEFARTARIPAIYPFRDFVDAGGLMSYSSSAADVYRSLARYVDRILKGAKPADLPVEQPTKFELVINMKTAKSLGLTIPPSLLLRADHVID